jgi:outer membrane protein
MIPFVAQRSKIFPSRRRRIWHPCLRFPGKNSIRIAGVFLLLASPLMAQSGSSNKFDYSKNLDSFPQFYRVYKTRRVPDVDLRNTPRIADSIRYGKLVLSLAGLKEMVLENNLDIAYASFNTSFADIDLLRARGGGAPRGAPGVQIPSSLFAGALGAGLGSVGGLGGGGSAGGVSGGARAVFAAPRGTYDPAILFNFSVDRTTSPLNTIVVSGVPTVTTHTTSLQTRYVQAFTSGTSISIGFNNQRQSSTQGFLLYNPSFSSTFSFTITHQILNGAGFRVNRRLIEVAENGRQVTREAYRQQVIASLAKAQNLYWDLVAARDSVRAAEKSLAVAQQLYQDNSVREQEGYLSHLDVETAEAEVASRQRDLIVAQTNLKMVEANLKNALSKQIDDALGEAQVETVDSLPEPKASDMPELAQALRTAMTNRPEILQAEGNLRNQEVAIKYAKNLLLPTLYLFGVYNGVGLYGDRLIGDIRIPGGISQALRQVRRFSYPDYAFGFSLSIPIRNRSAQADNLRAKLDKQQTDMSIQMTRSDIDLEVRKAVIGLIQAKSQVEAATKARELGEQNLSAEETRLLNGISTPYGVILRQRDYLAAQLAEVQARVAYAKALVEMNRSTGILDTK